MHTGERLRVAVPTQSVVVAVRLQHLLHCRVHSYCCSAPSRRGCGGEKSRRGRIGPPPPVAKVRPIIVDQPRSLDIKLALVPHTMQATGDRLELVVEDLQQRRPVPPLLLLLRTGVVVVAVLVVGHERLRLTAEDLSIE